MNRLSHSLLLLCLAAGPAAADEVVPWANKFFTGKEEAPPAMIVHDFGTLPQGAVRTHKFAMTNIYAFPIQVEQPRPSCGCVSVVEFTGKMDSKQSGHIEIKIDTTRVIGPKEVMLPVKFVGLNPKTGATFFSEARLVVKAVSRPDIAMTPGEFVFGVNPAGVKSGDKHIDVTYNGRLAGWAITGTKYKKELFDVKVVPLGGRGTSYRVVATLKDSAPAGDITEQIELTTNDPAAPVLMVSVTGKVQVALSLVGGEGGGDTVRLGTVDIGKKAEKNVIVRNDKPFKIAAVAGQGDGVTVSLLPVPAAKSQVVTVQFEPAKAGAVKKTLVIKTDANETIELTVEATGKAEAPPAKGPTP